MNVINFLKNENNSIKGLEHTYGIKVKDYPEHQLYVLNYSQTDSPKTHPIVIECRGLILDYGYNVVCRPFDRFFNAGEAPETVRDFDITRAVCHEKMDGSLIKIYFSPYHGWQCATRGTAFAEAEVNGFDLTFRDLVHRALECKDHYDFQERCRAYLNEELTYMFELTAMENRVVRRYEGTCLWFLGARGTQCGEDFSCSSGVQMACQTFCWNMPKLYKFDSVEASVEAAKHLEDLDEGYVFHDPVSNIRQKVKSPAYVAVHHIRGEGLNPKRIKQLVLTGEEDEYLLHFPEDSPHIYPYRRYLDGFVRAVLDTYTTYKHIEDQKQFALAIRDYTYSGLLFSARRDSKHPMDVFADLSDSQQLKVFDSWLELRQWEEKVNNEENKRKDIDMLIRLAKLYPEEIDKLRGDNV